MENNKHLVAAGREFAETMSDDTPLIAIAKMMARLSEELDVQTARSDALAAENAELKNAISCHAAGFTVCEACGEENISGNDDVCRALNETPVTDAFLAEVRAQGVEGIYQFNTDKVGVYLDGDVCGLIDGYVAQLRSNSNGGAV